MDFRGEQVGDNPSPAAGSNVCIQDCDPIYAENDRFVEKIIQRYWEYIADKHKLPMFGKNSRWGHRQQYRGWQGGLRNRLELANSNFCLAFRKDARDWATRPLP